MDVRSRWLVLALLVACSKGDGTSSGAGDKSEGSTPLVGSAPTEDVAKLSELSAEELVDLQQRRNGGFELSASELAELAEYDRVLQTIMSRTDAAGPWDTTKACILTRDYELWVLPGASPNRFTVKDRNGKVLAERVDEERLRGDFSYLHNLLHPEYSQFNDIGYSIDVDQLGYGD